MTAILWFLLVLVFFLGATSGIEWLVAHDADGYRHAANWKKDFNQSLVGEGGSFIIRPLFISVVILDWKIDWFRLRKMYKVEVLSPLVYLEDETGRWKIPSFFSHGQKWVKAYDVQMIEAFDDPTSCFNAARLQNFVILAPEEGMTRAQASGGKEIPAEALLYYRKVRQC